MATESTEGTEAMNIEKQIFMGMIEGDLQQGLSLLEDDKFRMAIAHFEEAVVKVRELESVTANNKEIARLKKLAPKDQPLLEMGDGKNHGLPG